MYRSLGLVSILAGAQIAAAVPTDWNPLIKAVAEVIALAAAYFLGHIHGKAAQVSSDKEGGDLNGKSNKPTS